MFPWFIQDQGVLIRPFGLYSRLVTKFTAKLGDLGIFLNGTWHGLAPGKGTGSIILLNLSLEEGAPAKQWLLPEKTEYGDSFKEVIGENIYNRMSFPATLIKKYGRTYSLTKNSRKVENIEPNLLASSITGRKDFVVKSLIDKPDRRLIDRILFKRKYNLRSILLLAYFFMLGRVFIRVSQVYQVYKKFRQRKNVPIKH